MWRGFTTEDKKTKTEGIKETALSLNLLCIFAHPSLSSLSFISIKVKLSLSITLDCFIS